ncbi:hypothetical protein [Sandaracinus amylolyticus]|uniref:Uncharacterized protein n=1 Tax=Sandaracinus amylolyticus TaxID=927083 RepID=A0A0F6SEU5_9BACT|nr:hypothetical protein [Sandaracinus amylolyticus]AKF05804.1 hypothetical protein DB32_002953 [Sandaracinus amylolyticus]
MLSVLSALAGCTDRGGGDPLSPFDAGSFDAGSTTTPDSGPRPDGGPRLDDVLVYAHSADTLFTFSPYTETVETVGRFTLAGGGNAPDMIDLAVNADGDVYTAGYDTLFQIDPETAVATPVGDFDVDGERFFALTFVAAGTLGAAETMIGATNAGAYYEIDVRDASAELLGTYPDEWLSSGDLVSIEGLGTYATLKREDEPTDVLARIDFLPSGESRVTVLGSTGYTQLFGLGYWGRVLYGFSNDGELVEIDRTTGEGHIATAATGTDEFWGAGVTTKVPFLE